MRAMPAGSSLKAASRVTILGAAVNVVLTVVKGLAGVLAGSSVMVADAVHSLSDLVSDMVALFSLRVAAKPPDESHPYGHGRFETLGTVVLALVLLAVAAGIAVDSWERFGTSVAPEQLALWAALISVVAKELLYHVTLRVGRKIGSPLVVANAWHHRSDALSSIAAFAGILGARAGFPILDPVAAIVVAALIAYMSIVLLRDAVREVTDASLRQDMLGELKVGVQELPGVVNLHEVRARRMGSRTLVDLHVEVEGSTTVSDGHQVAERVRLFVEQKYPEVAEVLVHVDPEPDEHVGAGVNLQRPRAALEREVREVAGSVDGVDGVTHLLVHFLGGRVTVEVNIRVDSDLRVRDAAAVGRALRARLEAIADIAAADIHLELDEHTYEEVSRPG